MSFRHIQFYQSNLKCFNKISKFPKYKKECDSYKKYIQLSFLTLHSHLNGSSETLLHLVYNKPIYICWYLVLQMNLHHFSCDLSHQLCCKLPGTQHSTFCIFPIHLCPLQAPWLCSINVNLWLIRKCIGSICWW